MGRARFGARGRLSAALVAMTAVWALAPAATAKPTVPAAPAGDWPHHRGAQASIIGGTPAAIADFPSLAFIAAEDRFTCTGSVIAPRVVLTAGHCVEDLEVGGFTSPGAYTVVTGSANPRQAGGNRTQVAETHVFPRFDPGTARGDAALLVLSTPTPAPAIPLATAADGALYAGGAGVLLAGWGLTSPNSRSAPDNLRFTSNVVLDPGSCRSRTRSYYPPYSTAEQMCTIDPPDRRNGACFGDSGGPVIAQRADGTPVEIGIVSTGGPQCSTKVPNIFTRADLVSTWAAEWVAAIETGAPPPALKAKLPRLTQESAQGLVAGVLRGNLGNLFLQNRGLRGGCRRLGSARMKCELLWQHGPKVYFATVTVFYVLRQNTVAWDNSFVFRRASVRCLRSNAARCPVEVKRG
ncbi:MAG TPA: serine protease [Solirubrobacterales bacterium]|nr:serine protease [Solirubrobacterales bacterium]